MCEWVQGEPPNELVHFLSLAVELGMEFGMTHFSLFQSTTRTSQVKISSMETNETQT